MIIVARGVKIHPSKHPTQFLPWVYIQPNLSCIPSTANSPFLRRELSCEFLAVIAPLMHLALAFLCRAYFNPLTRQSRSCSQHTLCCHFFLQNLFIRLRGPCSQWRACSLTLTGSSHLLYYPLDNQGTSLVSIVTNSWRAFLFNLGKYPVIYGHLGHITSHAQCLVPTAPVAEEFALAYLMHATTSIWSQNRNLTNPHPTTNPRCYIR